jgi:hypothetical protein
MEGIGSPYLHLIARNGAKANFGNSVMIFDLLPQIRCTVHQIAAIRLPPCIPELEIQVLSANMKR